MTVFESRRAPNEPRSQEELMEATGRSWGRRTRGGVTYRPRGGQQRIAVRRGRSKRRETFPTVFLAQMGRDRRGERASGLQVDAREGVKDGGHGTYSGGAGVGLSGLSVRR
jgi:hypothetical protein